MFNFEPLKTMYRFKIINLYKSVLYIIKKYFLFHFTELRLAQLALDPSNSPGWDVLEQERSVSTKMPLFVKSYNAFYAKSRQSEVTCGSSYTLFIQSATRSLRPQT